MSTFCKYLLEIVSFAWPPDLGGWAGAGFPEEATRDLLCVSILLPGIWSGQRESNPHFVPPLGSRSALGEQKTVIYNQKLRHTCVKICVTFSRFPRSGQFNGLARARSPYWYGVYSVVSPGSQRRWVRKSTKKRKRSEAKEILDAWQKTADRDAAGNLDQARIREIVLKTVERVTGERTDSPTVAEWLERD